MINSEVLVVLLRDIKIKASGLTSDVHEKENTTIVLLSKYL